MTDEDREKMLKSKTYWYIYINAYNGNIYVSTILRYLIGFSEDNIIYINYNKIVYFFK